jgi:putative chitinase
MSAVPPTNNPASIIDEFINYATQHLTTVSGVINTISLYPAVPSPVPGPGVINWVGYTVPPSVPTPPFPTVDFENNLTQITEIDATQIEMTDAQLTVGNLATLSGANISESTAVAFDDTQNTFITNEYEDLEFKLMEMADSIPTPPEYSEIENGIIQTPNYKTNVQVPPEVVFSMKKYNIARTPIQRAHFLAQCAHESGMWIYKEELASGAQYEGRLDLGNTDVGDGKLYKGRGYIQLTGKANYKKFGALMGVDIEKNPTLVSNKYYADVSCLFWKANRIDQIATDVSERTIKYVTKKINGGYNGLAERIRLFNMYWVELQKDPTLWS